jgi:hypothetical protein
MIEQFVTGSDLSKVLKITHQRISQLVQESVIQKEADGKFDLSVSIDSYYAFKYKTPNRINLDTEKALHEKAKREMAEIELDKIKGKIFTDEEIKLAIVPMIIACRNRILAIAPTVAEKLVGRSAKEIESMLDKINKEALSELAAYDQIKIGSSEYEVAPDGTENTEVST